MTSDRNTIRTTLGIPADLPRAVDQLVAEGKAKSRSAFVVLVLRRELAVDERTVIDADLAGMAADAAYQAEAEQIAEAFAASDWEALCCALDE